METKEPAAGELESAVGTTALEWLPPALRAPAAALAQRSAMEQLVERIWQRDATVWTDSGEQRWLGWLSGDERVEDAVSELAQHARAAGWRDILLLGMGGSSLGAEVLEQMLRPYGEDGVELVVLDSTDPRRIEAAVDRVSTSRGAVVCASKSGSTLETAVLSRYFETRFPAERFLAVTDPDSALEEHAKSHGWFKSYRGVPEIGGRFSVLSVFGQVPAAAAGLPIARVLAGAAAMRQACRNPDFQENPGLATGIALAAAVNLGRNKLQLLCEPRWRVFRLWLEQLLAESTGKAGRGLVPVEWCDDAASDVVSVHLVDGSIAEAAAAAGASVVSLEAGGGLFDGAEDLPERLGAEFFRWQFATAVAGALLSLNPFDQPDVELAKVKAREITGRVQAGTETTLSAGDPLTGSPEGRGELAPLLEGLVPPEYLGLLLFLPVEGALREELWEFAQSVQRATGASVTWGEGPRYLHSTGQVHKGGPPQGRFVVLSRQFREELPDLIRVPETSEVVPGLAFATVQSAQAAGDAAALRERGRPVLTVGVRDSEEAVEWLRRRRGELEESR